MELTKITLFLAWVAVSHADEVFTTNFLGGDIGFEANPNDVESMSLSKGSWGENKPNDNCVCLPPRADSAPSVEDQIPDIIDSNELRLVMYLFKNTVTRKIHVYVPNKAKQIGFPDCAYEINELLTYLRDTSDFNRVLLREMWDWVDIKRYFYPKNFSTILKPIHAITNIPTDHDNDGVPDIIDQLKQSQPLQLNRIIRKYLYRFKLTKPILQTLTADDDTDKVFQLKRLYPDIYKQFISKINKLYPRWLMDGTQKQYKTDNLKNFPFDTKFIPIFNGNASLLQPQEISVYTPTPTIIDEMFTISNLSLKEWIRIEVNGLNNDLKFASKDIDVELLKSFLLNALQTNALSLSREGNVVDTFGRKIQLYNIILRPILIGESPTVDKVLNDGLLRVPSDIIFLEALLISESDVKSLAIIPITHIFTDHHDEEESRSTVQIIESIKTCVNNVCQTKKVCKNVYGEDEACEEYSRSDDTEVSERRSECNRNKCNGCKSCKAKSKTKDDVLSSNLPAETPKTREGFGIPIVGEYIPNPNRMTLTDINGKAISTAVEADQSSIPYGRNYPYSIL